MAGRGSLRGDDIRYYGWDTEGGRGGKMRRVDFVEAPRCKLRRGWRDFRWGFQEGLCRWAEEMVPGKTLGGASVMRLVSHFAHCGFLSHDGTGKDSDPNRGILCGQPSWKTSHQKKRPIYLLRLGKKKNIIVLPPVKLARIPVKFARTTGSFQSQLPPP